MTNRSGAEIDAHFQRHRAFYVERGRTKPFEVGKDYQTHGGETVTCIEAKTTPGYECARFSDGDERWHAWGGYFHRHTGAWVPQRWEKHTTGWRYNRDSDRGRMTATDFDDPRCVIPEPAE